jgi:hypothetical protein
VGTLKEGGDAIPSLMTRLEISINANNRYQYTIDSQDPSGIVQGNVDVTGRADFFLEDLDLYDKFDGDTESSIEGRLTDDDGNVMIYTVPALYYTEAAPAAAAMNQDVPLSMPFDTIGDSDHGGSNIQFDFLDA